MGQLPKSRVAPGTVFSVTGTDFAGPITIKRGKPRKPEYMKKYICDFVSFSVKAVHIKAVMDLSAEAFIASLRRFTAREASLLIYVVITAQTSWVLTMN